MAQSKGAPRKPVAFSEDEHEILARAAYWEGFKSVRKFVVLVMGKHIEERERLRGERYAKPPTDLLDDDS